MIIRQCVQVARGTDAIGTTFKAGDMAIINITSTGTCTTCSVGTTAESGSSHSAAYATDSLRRKLLCHQQPLSFSATQERKEGFKSQCQ